MKQFTALLLCCAALLVCCACGQETTGEFRPLEVIGTKHYGVICRKDDPLAPRVNAAVSVLAANGTLAALSARWLGQNAVTLAGDAGALAALEPEASERVLIVGLEAAFKPLSYEENGALCGMNVDIAQELGALLGRPVVFQPISAEEVGAQLASGNIDCALGFDTAAVSAEKYDVGLSYMDSDIVLAVRTESAVRRTKDLKGLRVGTVADPSVQAAVKSAEKLTKYASGATAYLSLARCIDALDQGWCAAVALDSLMLRFWTSADRASA